MNTDLKSRLNKLSESVNKLSSYRDFIKSQVAGEEKEINKLVYQADLRQKTAEVFKSWLEDSLKKNVDSISQLVTTGLRHIIHDQNLTFRIRQEMKHQRLSMRFTLQDDGDEADPMTNFGGGAVLVISLILRLAIMARTKAGNLLLLDESLSELANQYIPNAGSFLRELSENMGVNILMVTHNELFLNNAHTVYEGYKDTDLKLKPVK